MASSSPSGVEFNESSSSERMAEAGVALSFPATDSTSPPSPSKLPRRLRRRLCECRSPSTAEEIEAKLKEADLRRQQFYELLSSKARPRQRSPSWSSSPEVDLGQQLEAKLNAAEQKRLSILAKAQMRLARLDEMRQAAKNGVEMRVEKQRGELGMKVKSRVQQAEENRLLILKSCRQQRAAKKERTAQSLMRRMIQESKYKECVRAAIHQKRVAAERKRLGLLEAERLKAHARLLQVQKAAKSVYTQREMERIKKKHQLEDRLKRAGKLRAEFLRERKNANCSPHASTKVMQEQAENLARKLARCWRWFIKLRGTTYSLAKTFEGLNISETSIKSMPFEQLALLIGSDVTLKTAKSLLDRIEVHVRVRSSAGMENIDHLLKRVATPKRKGNVGHAGRSRGQKRSVSGEGSSLSCRKLLRYPVRVVLCAYMILGHPEAVLSGKGVHETSLAQAAVKFIQEFELLMRIFLDNSCMKSFSGYGRVTFRSQLEAFDKAWCLYLYRFVVWKVKDAKLLEEDLVRAACQLELSMMHTCKLTLDGDNESGSPMPSPVAHIASPVDSVSSETSPSSVSGEASSKAGVSEQRSNVARSLLKEDAKTTGQVLIPSIPAAHCTDVKLSDEMLPITENEKLVNEIVHEHRHAFADNLDIGDEDDDNIKTKIRETMEQAFWDGVTESMEQQQPDYSWLLKLLTEVRDALCEMSPNSWRQEITNTIDVDILSQVSSSGTLDISYLGNILEYALVTLQKLSAPANDDVMQAGHQNLLRELKEVSQSGDNSDSSRAMAVVKGLRYVLKQIQALKREISRARVKMIEPVIKGPAGLEYLRKAFSSRYGPPPDCITSLPLTKSWLSRVRTDAEQEWREYVDSVSTLPTKATPPQGIPSTALRTGGNVSATSRMRSLGPATTGLNHETNGKEQPECQGERIDLLVRLGLLKLVNEIEGLMQETLPESLKLNVSRLRAVQSLLQKIIVISTSMLILRQTLVSEHLVRSPSHIETIISQSAKQLSELLDKVEDVGISQIVESIIGLPDDIGHVANLERLGERKDMMVKMLSKSLKSGDAIVTHVSRSIYLAVRGAVFGGTGSKGRQLVEMALRRVGAALLTDKVMEVAEVLIVVATVSQSVHGAWYGQLLENM
ncbi:hypothetical protein Cgig2_022226 [Carnegiea gigantea]|uniref:T-complex protein 11 n=1 Tax=Carnegiea gigantea TaxID=171969 RepID=A0A9Q1QJX2_9CARY|nr:hypothetical protein Cgig2_022226 [Carnegiea gigantea]